LKIFLEKFTQEDKSLATFFSKVEKYYAKLNEINRTKEKIQSYNQAIQEDFNSFKYFFKNPGPDAKKALKPKSQEKVEKEMGLYAFKTNSHLKSRLPVEKRFDEVYLDVGLLRELVL